MIAHLRRWNAAYDGITDPDRRFLVFLGLLFLALLLPEIAAITLGFGQRYASLAQAAVMLILIAARVAPRMARR